jgi:RIO kinase 1
VPQTRSVPNWVIRDFYTDTELGTLRAGKEAGCFLVRRTSGDRFCLLVRKDYRRRSDRETKSAIRAGERGVRRDAYQHSVVILDARSARAASKRTAWGREVIEAVWAGREFDVLRRLWAAGASVPYPVEATDHGYLMQYIGTVGAAAPRLADMRLEPDEAPSLFDRLIKQVALIVGAGVVHADLSPYNVLVQHGRPWLIDFPQAVDLDGHPNAADFLRRDVESLCRYFSRRGVACDAAALTRELLAGRG